MDNIFFKFGSKLKASSEFKREMLGSKGVGLAEMSSLGIPVPEGFTISTDLCKYYYQNKASIPSNFFEDLKSEIKELEKITNKNFGGKNPLLLSVRSGAAVSMPGMMDTILNVGLNDEIVEYLVEESGDASFALDSYRRLLQEYGDLVLGIHGNVFEVVVDNFDEITSEKSLRKLVAIFKDIILEKTGSDFPQDPYHQLEEAITTVLKSWMSERAMIYRALNEISENEGTAVSVQSMVFGNMGETSATGVVFSRDPSTGVKELYGEYLLNAQGEDVVSGKFTPKSIKDIERIMPSVYKDLNKYAELLEKHFREMQDIEFTIEKEKLYILQTRTGKRSAASAVKIAVDMVEEKIINKQEAIMSVDPSSVNQMLHAAVNYKGNLHPIIATGLAASPGAASGIAVFSPYDAEELAHHHKVILIRQDTSPEDIKGMHLSDGILTVRGGMTSHAAVVARGMGRPCVCGTSGIVVNEMERYLKVGDKIIKQGELITIDGNSGNIFAGEVDLIAPDFSKEFEIFLEWVDQERALKVRANAENILDSKTALRLGAEGIGLCRTEHMFFREDKILLMREMIVSPNVDQKAEALAKLLPIHKEDFKDIFRIMNGKSVNIRLLDPPLHEFLPQNEEDKRNLSEDLSLPWVVIEKRLNALHEVNPMMGNRGCRLGIISPEIYEMQVEAIFTALEELKSENIKVDLEIMIPLIGYVGEYKNLKALVELVVAKLSFDIKYKLGTMIELPRAAIKAGEIAAIADFFSFGTNDLTQTTFGISRDDSGSFIPGYLSKKVIKDDPFVTLDQEGVGEIVKMAIERGKKAKPDLHLGICGEHGGDPKSIQFFHDNGLDYISCSPYRVPIARIAAAQANIKNRRK